MDILRLQWEKIKENIRIEYDITDIAYNIWVKPLKYGKCENKQITILIPDNSPEIQDHIEKNYTDCFQSALSDLLLDNYAVIFLPEEDIQTENNDTVSFMSEDDINAIIEKNEAVDYGMPPIFLLEENKENRNGDNDEYTEERALILQQTLASYGVEATIIGISQGVTVTRFELHLGEAVRVKTIVNLADELKVNLGVQSVRIEKLISGKTAIGVEIPNTKRFSVSIRELIESEEFQKAESPLTIAVGKDVSGHTVVSDIAKLPHLLIAGIGGSGKKDFMDSIILSILYKADPGAVKLILIDPNGVKFSTYNGIPHLLTPVVTNLEEATAVLSWALTEVERRYRVFAESDVRTINAYNELISQGRISSVNGRLHSMPWIVIIIYELSDLMMVASGYTEKTVCGITQLARAAGIHLIIATQRMSVDVITGLIKANIPSRVAFKVSNTVDSRNILDTGGAEELLGDGDMFFYPQGYSSSLRVQGASVSDDEVKHVTNFYKNRTAKTKWCSQQRTKGFNESDPDEANMMENNKETEHPEKTDPDERYRFDNFMVTPGNTLAHCAGKNVSKNPGKVFNPLIIYGERQTGKTHLMMAIGNEISENTDLRLIYTTSEKFINELKAALCENSLSGLKNVRGKYSRADVLLMDDIQYIQKYPFAMEEFFYILNDLLQNKKAVILTSDQHPIHMKMLDERFISRFKQGTIIDIKKQ